MIEITSLLLFYPPAKVNGWKTKTVKYEKKKKKNWKRLWDKVREKDEDKHTLIHTHIQREKKSDRGWKKKRKMNGKKKMVGKVIVYCIYSARANSDENTSAKTY